MLNASARRISHISHQVYKVYEGPDLLYVGMTVNVFKRLKEHKKYARWYPIATHIDVKTYIDRNAARAVEALAIREEAPRFNVTKENAWGCVVSEPTDECYVIERDEYMKWVIYE